MDRKTLELRIQSLRLDPPFAGPARMERLRIATLIWLRPLIAERISSKPVKSVKGTLDLSGAAWSERILFKENVEGSFGLVLRVTEPLSETKIARFLAPWGAGLLRLAGTETGKLAGDPWSAALARIPLQLLAGELGNAAKEPTIVAAGRVTLRPGQSEILRVPLVSPRDRYRTETRRIAGRRSSRRIRIAAEHKPVGEVVLALEYP